MLLQVTPHAAQIHHGSLRLDLLFKKGREGWVGVCGEGRKGGNDICFYFKKLSACVGNGLAFFGPQPWTSLDMTEIQG